MIQLNVFYVIYKQSNKTGCKLKYLSMVKKKVSHSWVQRGTILWTKTYIAFIWCIQFQLTFEVKLEKTEIQLISNKDEKGITLKFGLN